MFTTETILYAIAAFYAAASITFFIGLEIARAKEQYDFNYLEILAALGWPIILFIQFKDWIKSKWR